MGGTPLLGGSWGPILQLDMENWIGFLEVLNLTYNILDFVQGLFFPDDLLNVAVKHFQHWLFFTSTECSKKHAHYNFTGIHKVRSFVY